MICRHCQKLKANRPRGLCWTCYYLPGVRANYESMSKYGRRGSGNFFGQAPLPELATPATPGSPEKIEVLAERARLKQALWHPQDGRVARGQPARAVLAMAG